MDSYEVILMGNPSQSWSGVNYTVSTRDGESYVGSLKVAAAFFYERKLDRLIVL